MVAEMAAALEGRTRKTSWVKPITRADMLTRYANLLDDPNEAAQQDFVQWVVRDAVYLTGAGNFEEFCCVYLLAEPPDVALLWGMTGEGPQ